MKIQENHLWICLPALLLAAGSALAGVQHVTECGTVLTEPGNYHLKNDLFDCPGDGITIKGSSIMLDLKGHTVSCADGDIPVSGVSLIGTLDTPVRKVKVKNGHVSNCSDGILLVHAEDSKIMKMTSSGNRIWEGVYGTGITVWRSHNNVIMKSHAFGNESHGIGSWESSGNAFRHNTSNGNGDGYWLGSGIDVGTTTDSLFVCNRIFGNVSGIALWPDTTDNLVQGNEVSRNILDGIDMVGLAWDGSPWQPIPSGNTVKTNIAENNGWFDIGEIYFDLMTDDVFVEPAGTCQNTWKKNRFGTEFGPPGCFGASFDLEDICASDD